MIETIIIKYLGEHLKVNVSGEMPDKPKPPFVTVEKTGGGRSVGINTAMIAICSYGATMAKTAEINETVKTVMDDITELDEVCKASLNSDYNFTDTEAKRYRYQAVYDIVYY